MKDFHNPLIMPILAILKQEAQPITEHELIGRLQPQLAAIADRPLSAQLALFQTHFLVMNALYQLHRELEGDGFCLAISPLKIVLQASARHSGSELLAEAVDEPLRDYYLAWENFEETNEADVEELLGGFWRYYLAADKQEQAYRVLGLSAGAEWPTVQKAYRHLIADKHPDRGGSALEFMEVREAYEVLVNIRVNG